MFAGLMTATVCMYWGALQRWFVGSMCRWVWLHCKHFEEILCLRLKLLLFLIQRHAGDERVISPNGGNLTLTFTTSTSDMTEMGSGDKKDLYKIWLRVCTLIKTNSDLHDMLCSNWQRGLSSGTKFLDIGRTVFEKSVSIDRSWVEYRNSRQWRTVSIT